MRWRNFYTISKLGILSVFPAGKTNKKNHPRLATRREHNILKSLFFFIINSSHVDHDSLANISLPNGSTKLLRKMFFFMKSYWERSVFSNFYSFLYILARHGSIQFLRTVYILVFKKKTIF